MSSCDDRIRQHFDRMNEKANQDIRNTFDLIDKMKSGESVPSNWTKHQRSAFSKALARRPHLRRPHGRGPDS